MLKVDVIKLMSALSEIQAFSLPEMNAGTQHLFDKVYKKLADGEDVYISDLDLDFFDMEDIAALDDIYNKIIEKNCCDTNRVINNLREIKPSGVVVGFL